jgi:hypothetical protein
VTQEKFIEWSLVIFTPHQISDSIKSVMWAGHVAYMGKKGNAYRVLVGKPERKRPLSRTRHSSKDHIRMDLKKNRLGGHGLA